MALWRYRPNGSRDFFKTIDLGGDETAQAIAVQPDGKIVVAGEVKVDQDHTLYFIARFNDDGSLDKTFGGGGYTFGDFNNQFNSAGNALALQPDGKIVVTGWNNDNGNFNFGLARHLANGSPDLGFGGGDGKVITDLGPIDVATDLALLPDGRILVGGHGGANGNQMVVTRYSASGEPDTFGNLAIVADFSIPARAHSLTVAGNGDIIIAGCTVGSAYQFAVARFTSSGQPDPGFSGDGKATFTLSNHFECARGLAQDPTTGDLILAGYAHAGPDDLQFALARVKGTGPLPPPPPGPTPTPNQNPNPAPTPEPNPGGEFTTFLPLVLN
jgi:uncharacterized delta-60 repeat protein